MFSFNHVTISVENLDETLEFYKKFGFVEYKEYHDDNVDIVMIHDSARAYLDIDLLNLLINEIKNGNDSAIPYKNCTNAIFDSEKQRYITTSNLKIIETPQVFNFKKLKEAYKNKRLELYKDDGSIYLNKHKCLNFVYNPKINTKITTREDLEEAERRL